MNASQKLRACLLAGALASSAAPAADPQPAPDVQELIALLNKIVAESAVANAAAAATEPAPAPEPVPAPAPAPKAATPAPTTKAAAPAGLQPTSTALRTGGLQTSGLATSAPLGGQGSGAVARMAEDVWRTIFPQKQPRN